MDDSADLITLVSPDHHNMLVKGLWNMFNYKGGVDHDLGWGVKAHRCILDVFLSSEKLTMCGAVQLKSLGSLEYVLEFLYTGRVTVHRDLLPIMLGTSKESGFQLLEDAIANVATDVYPDRVNGDQKLELQSDVHSFVKKEHLTGQLQESLDSEEIVGGLASPVFEDVETWEIGDVDAVEFENVEAETILLIKQEPSSLLDDNEIKLEGPSDVGLNFQLLESETLLENEVTFKEELLQEALSDVDEVSEDALTEWTDKPSSSHVRSHVKEKLFTCKSCDMSFEKRVDLVGHMLVCTVPETNRCSDCGKCFTSSDHLKRHVKTQICKKSLQCDTPADDKPFNCDICGKSFLYLNSLKLHESAHAGAKPFRCERCGKSFTRKAGLATHMYIHSGDKTLFCDGCSKYFSSQEKLKTHKKGCKKPSRLWHPYCCKTCGRTFVSKIFLIRHVCAQTK